MSPFLLSLFITAIGMGLVFIAIIILWGLMEIIVKTTADKEPGAEEVGTAEIPGSGVAGEAASGKKALAAAAAVGVALSLRKRALQIQSRGDEPAAQNIPTAWQSAGRLARINQRSQVFTRKG